MDKIAQLDFPALEAKAVPKFANKEIGDVVAAIIPYFYAFTGIALLIYLIYGGFKYMTSSGDPAKIQVGKSTIVNALIGFFIVFVSYWIVEALAMFFGLEPILDIF